MRCRDISFGTYDCSYGIWTPFKCGYDNEFKLVAIDKCLIKEIIDLWEHGIRTIGCCCGHGDAKQAFIQVELEDIPKMKALGYEEHFDACRPTAKDAFNPKTVLTYGEIQKGFNLWEERW